MTLIFGDDTQSGLHRRVIGDVELHEPGSELGGRRLAALRISRSERYTECPRSINCRAVSKPSPLLAPVMSVTVILGAPLVKVELLGDRPPICIRVLR